MKGLEMVDVLGQCLAVVATKHNAAVSLLVGVIENCDHVPAEQRDSWMAQLTWANADIVRIIQEIENS